MKTRGQLGAQSTTQSGDEGLTKVSIFHSFLSSLVTNYKTFTFYSGRERKELKRKEEEEEEEEEGKCQVANGDKDSERERHLCETKCFCNCMGDLVVWLINKTFDFSIFLLL